MPPHTATGQLYVKVISTIPANTATGKLYAEVGYEYGSERGSIRMKLYAHIQCTYNSHSIIQQYVHCIAVRFAMSRYLVKL